MSCNFQWDFVYPINPHGFFHTPGFIDKYNVSYTLSVFERHKQTHQSKYSTGKIPHITIRTSTITEAVYGMFAERIFVKDDIISVYMGIISSKIDHTSNYCMKIKNGVFLKPSPDKCYIGDHKSNDRDFYILIKDNRTQNNAKFEGIELISTTRILKGHDIFVEYYSTVQIS